MKSLRQILVIEDEQDITIIVKMILEEYGGYVVRTCPDGQSGIEAVKNFQPDLILLDVMMPGFDGIQTIQALRNAQSTCEAPVIFMTAKIQEKEIEAYRKLGAIDVIAKPFDPFQLNQTIQQIWDNYQRTIDIPYESSIFN